MSSKRRNQPSRKWVRPGAIGLATLTLVATPPAFAEMDPHSLATGWAHLSGDSGGTNSWSPPAAAASNDFQPVPEPRTLAFFGLGILTLFLLRRTNVVKR